MSGSVALEVAAGSDGRHIGCTPLHALLRHNSPPTTLTLYSLSEFLLVRLRVQRGRVLLSTCFCCWLFSSACASSGSVLEQLRIGFRAYESKMCRFALIASSTDACVDLVLCQCVLYNHNTMSTFLSSHASPTYDSFSQVGPARAVSGREVSPFCISKTSSLYCLLMPL